MNDEPRKAFEVEISPTPENIAALEGECDKLRTKLAAAAAMKAAAQPFVDAIRAFDHDLYLDGLSLGDHEQVEGHGLGGSLTFGKWRRLAIAAAEVCKHEES
jgi:hypothetical protein